MNEMVTYLLPYLFVAVVVIGFVFWSKRDPNREIPITGIVAPADGKISVLRKEVNGKVRVGVFMNVYDVHVNRAPMSGYVKEIEHIPGGFLPAFSKESDRNERVKIIFTTVDPMGKFKEKKGEEWEVVLIAGALARRIKPYIKMGDHIERGERIGHIEFGSRVDVVFPTGRGIEEVLVKRGERVRAGESILMEN